MIKAFYLITSISEISFSGPLLIPTKFAFSAIVDLDPTYTYKIKVKYLCIYYLANLEVVSGCSWSGDKRAIGPAEWREKCLWHQTIYDIYIITI